MDGIEDNFENLNYRFKILQYFDIITQTFKIVQFILYKREDLTAEKLLQYIQQSFIKVDSLDTQWHDDLMQSLNRMPDDPNEPKLCLYGYKDKLTGMVDTG